MIKKLIIVACMLTALPAMAADQTTVDDFISDMQTGIAEYENLITAKNFSAATNKVDELVGFFAAINKQTAAIKAEILNGLQVSLSSLPFDTFKEMLFIKADILEAHQLYKAALAANDFDTADNVLNELTGFYKAALLANYWKLLSADLVKDLKIKSFDKAYIDQLGSDIDAAKSGAAGKADKEKKDKEVPTFAPGGSASSAKPASADKVKEDIDKKKAEEAKNRGGAPKPKPAATTLITDKAEFDLVVTALDKVFTDAKAADKSIMGEIASKSATKQKLINAGDQIKPVIGQVEGDNTTFKRAQASAKAMKATSEQEAQLKAIEGAIKGFTADVKTIDAAAAAA